MSGLGPVQAAVGRLHEAQDQLNASTLIIDDAVDTDRGGGLAGLTLAVKDIIDQKGLVTTCGSAFYREIPARTAPVIERLEADGAVVVARASLHEFAYGFSSENHWFGAVRNPWDIDTSPGGSSGGSAVAVAAGLVDGAVGSDTGGSIRVPAAMTGIYGLKVTHGRVPTGGVFPLAPSLDTVGPFARNAATLGMLYRAMAGVRPRSMIGEIEGPIEDIEGLRVVVPRTWVDGAPMEAAVGAAFQAGLNDLEALGAKVVHLDLPDLVPWGQMQELAGAEAAHVHKSFRAAGKPYGPEVDARLTAAEGITSDQYLDAHAWRSRLIEVVGAAWANADVLATPAIAHRRKVIGEDRIGDQHYRPVLSWFSALVNSAGNPAVALPLRNVPDNGPPPSLQLIAPWWQEELLLGIAGHLEARNVVGFSPPPIFYGGITGQTSGEA